MIVTSAINFDLDLYETIPLKLVNYKCYLVVGLLFDQPIGYLVKLFR
jgi:hypothetical protein